MEEYPQDTRFFLTLKGRQAVLDAWIEQYDCCHVWELKRPGVLECTICGEVHMIRRPDGQVARQKWARE